METTALVFLCYFVFFVFISPASGKGHTLHLDEHTESAVADFALGHFYLGPRSFAAEDFAHVLTMVCLLPVRETNQAVRHMLASWGMSLNTAATFANRNGSLERLSHDINSCSVSPLLDEVGKELLYNVALSVWPWNVYASKNLAWMLEWEGSARIARSLYSQTAQITGDVGSLFHGVFVSPPLLWNEEEALSSHLKVLSDAHLLLTAIVTGQHRHVTTDPSLIIREYQLCWQYTGISPGVISQVYGIVLRHIFSFLSVADPFVVKRRPSLDAIVSNIAGEAQVDDKQLISSNSITRRTLRVGIVSEHEANSSPGLCLMSILTKLSLLRQHDTAQPVYHFIYFRRPDSATTFNVRMEELSQETVTLDNNPGNLELSRELIVAQRLDVIIFIALATEKFTVFLSQARLATVQIQFGIGHPITSGSTAVDYSVVSRLMFMTESSITRSPMLNATKCMEWSSKCEYERKKLSSGTYCSAMRQMGCITDAASRGVTAPTFYTEQVVLFDSLGYFIDSPLTYYPETRDFDPIRYAFESPCDELDLSLQEWGIFPNVSATMLGCGGAPRSSHLYIAIQNPKKMHPTFDQVLRLIIERDPTSKILVDDRMPCLVPRWKSTLRLTEKEIFERFVFVPRLEHRQYLKLVSLASVFLNTFPFGAGVTSSEAIALCVPVVVYADTTSVLHIALAQVRALGEPWITRLLATSVQDFVTKAVGIAQLESASNKSGLRHYRKELCQHNAALIGNEPLEEATQEWDRFLQRISQ